MSADGPSLPTSRPASRVAAELPHGVVTYTDEGPADAPVLIAVHGIPGSVRDFRYLAPQLLPALRVVRVDLPGFGGSAPVADAIRTLRGRARVVVALADVLGIDRFTHPGPLDGRGDGAGAWPPTHAARVRGLVLVASLALRLHRGLGAPPRTFAWVGHALSDARAARAASALGPARIPPAPLPGCGREDGR